MPRNLAQKTVLACAWACYASGVASAVAAWLFEGSGAQDPVRASLMASVVFFVGCGVVLHVIGKANLRGILSGSGAPVNPD